MVLPVTLLILTVIILIAVKIGHIYKNKINFFLEGLNRGFSIIEVRTLWQCASACELADPVSLFLSLPELTKCISQIKHKAEVQASESLQKLLSKLYDFRTKTEAEADKKRGLDSTRSLTNGQKLRIILRGKGVFASEIVNNGREIIIRIPTQQGQITVEGTEWIGKTLSVYLWRKEDARYVFDTVVTREGLFLGKPSLFLQHSANLVRTQKRNAVRAKCHIYSDLYILTEKTINYSKVETKPGYKCIIEDISEKGALIRIGGKGVPNIQIRLQFQLQNKLVVMFGVIRTVEYNEELKQSRLHFECIHLDDIMRNHVLSYVYNILPQSEKEIFDALSYTDEDEKADAESKEDENQNETVSARMEQEVSSSIPDYNKIKDTTEPDDDYSIEIPEDDSDDMEDTL